MTSEQFTLKRNVINKHFTEWLFISGKPKFPSSVEQIALTYITIIVLGL